MKTLDFLLDLMPFKFAIYQKEKEIFSYNITNHKSFLSIVKTNWANFNYNEINYMSAKDNIYVGLKFKHLDQDYILFSQVQKKATLKWGDDAWYYLGNVLFYITQIFKKQPELTNKQMYVELFDENVIPVN